MESDKLSISNRPIPREHDERGRFVVGNMGGGRPFGSRNKFTIVKERIVEAFLKNDRGSVAFEKTLYNSDGTINLEALRVIVSILPSEDFKFLANGDITININKYAGK